MNAIAGDARIARAMPGTALACFHCGERIDGEPAATLTIEGTERPMCCHGCAAVAGAIAGNGLGLYYRRRDGFARRVADDESPDLAATLECYDLPEMQAGFVRTEGDLKEAPLIVEGLRCAACVWLTETHLAQVPGVVGAHINYASARMVVRWDPARTRLSRVLAAVREIGYEAWPYDADRRERQLDEERATALRRLFVAAMGMMQVMMYAFPVYIAAAGSMTWDIVQLMRIASLILTTPVVVYSARPFFSAAWRDIANRRPGMDVPVALGIGAAFGASVWATVRGRGEVYFDSVSMFVFFLLAGRYLELLARRAAFASTDALVRAQPAFALRVVDAAWNAAGERIPVALLRCGDLVRVEPGERIPADATILRGDSAVDESLLTGESRPLPRASGDRVTGGSINCAGPLVLRVDAVGQDTVLAGIVRLVDRALGERPAIAELADRYAGVFVFALLLLSAAVGLAWAWFDPARAFQVTVALLVVSCPCALSLATPAALAAATGRLTREGVLVTRAHAIETLARTTHVVFDKTGTLTTGTMSLVDTHPAGRLDADACLELARALEVGSEHPIARALACASAACATEAATIEHVAGGGIEGWVAGRHLRIGSAAFVAGLSGRIEGRPPAAPGSTCIALGDDAGLLCWFVLQDVARPEAAGVVAALRAEGVAVSVASGDDPATVRAVATSLGIDDAVGGLTPAGKLERLRSLQQHAIVAMVGDGVNDAPVLAGAHVSIAVEHGTQLAQANADIVLLGSGIDGVPKARAIARKTVAVIRQNLMWALVYNAVAIPLAAFGFVTPWAAGIGMSASSLLVVLNALRLKAGDARIGSR